MPLIAKATLRKNVVSDGGAGGVYFQLFFSLFSFFFHFFGKTNSFFSYQKKKGKKKDFAAPRLATISAIIHAGQEINFF